MGDPIIEPAYTTEFHTFRVVAQRYASCGALGGVGYVAGIEIDGTDHVVQVLLKMNDSDVDTVFWNIIDGILVDIF